GVFSGGGYFAPPGSAVVKPGKSTVTPTGPGASPGASEIVKNAPKAVAEAARKAAGIDPASWQTFIKQTLTDWGIYAGLGVLLLLGLVFLVSAAGGGPAPVVIQRAGKKIAG